MSDPDGLLARVERLEAHHGVLATLHRYSHAIDAGNEAAWVALFTERGEFRVRPPDPRDAYAIRGHAELRAFIARHSRRPEAGHEHVAVHPVVAVEGERARCASRFFVLVAHRGRPVVRAFGRYDDELERGPDGTWRFAVREATIDAQDPGVAPLAYAR